MTKLQIPTTAELADAPPGVMKFYVVTGLLVLLLGGGLTYVVLVLSH